MCYQYFTSLWLPVSATHTDPSGDTDTLNGFLNRSIKWINVPLELKIDRETGLEFTTSE